MIRVVIFEDNRSLREGLAALIGGTAGFECRGAFPNCNNLLKNIAQTKPDVILMDINMPQLDGMSCAKEIRKLGDKQKAQIPIIAITGNAKNYTDQDFKDAGINEYLPKPLDFDKLVESVKKWTA